MNKVFLPEDRAVLELQRKNPSGALSALESNAPYELGSGINVSVQYWPMYLRGTAYLQTCDGAKALAQYKKILDHSGVSPLSPLLPLARLGVGRAYALLHDTTNAKTAYQDFFATWKDADPDIPILKEAQAEYSKLQ